MSNRLQKTLVGVAGLAALGLGGGALAHAGDNNRGDASEQVSGAGAEQAKAAALKVTHGGQANSVERDSENGATWEVEVTKKDGKTVDVRLDKSYDTVVVEGDGGE